MVRLLGANGWRVPGVIEVYQQGESATIYSKPLAA